MTLRRFADMPIKQKLIVIIVVITGAALLLSAVGIIAADSILFRGYLERDISGLASMIADNTTAALSFEDAKSAAETLGALRARPHVISACVYRANGTVLARFSRTNSPKADFAGGDCPPPRASQQIQFGHTELTASRPIVLNTRRIGTLVIAYDLFEIAERRNLYGGMVLGVLLVSSLIAFLLSSRLRDTIATPILKLAEATSAVSRTRNYSIRAKKVSSDELGILVDAFNEMLAGIQFRDNELRNALLAREVALQDAQNARDSLETTLASIGDAVIATDVEGRISFANRVALGLIRWPEPDIKGIKLEDVFVIVNEFTRAKIESPVSRVLRDGAIAGTSDHTVLIARDGTEIPIEESGAPILRETAPREGNPVQGTVLVFRDVTARRQADETSRLLASIFESSGDAIVTKDLNGTFTSWNSSAERIFGYSAAEAIGQSVEMLATPDRKQEMADILDRIRRNERIENYETVQRTKSGQLIHVSLTVSPLYDALGRVIGASKIARDISGRVQAAQRLAQLNADLQRTNENLARSNEDLERFAFVASHDLQEPLRMITVYSQLLVKLYPGAVDDERAATFVNNIVGGTQRMRELLADLLAYTEVGAEIEEPVEIVNLNSVLEKVMQNLTFTVSTSNASVAIDTLPTLNMYGSHLMPLFQNLIENAIKYRGSETPRIHVSVAEADGELQFSVADNGMGIAPEYHEKIFVAFKRLHGKAIPGTGIGLAICQRVVERYGGRIWVESEPGRGSNFKFTLPHASPLREAVRAEEKGGIN